MNEQLTVDVRVSEKERRRIPAKKIIGSLAVHQIVRWGDDELIPEAKRCYPWIITHRETGLCVYATGTLGRAAEVAKWLLETVPELHEADPVAAAKIKSSGRWRVLSAAILEKRRAEKPAERPGRTQSIDAAKYEKIDG